MTIIYSIINWGRLYKYKQQKILCGKICVFHHLFSFSCPKFAHWEFRLQFSRDSCKVGALLLVQLLFCRLIDFAFFLWWKLEMLHLLTVVAEKMEYKFFIKDWLNELTLMSSNCSFRVWSVRRLRRVVQAGRSTCSKFRANSSRHRRCSPTPRGAHVECWRQVLLSVDVPRRQCTGLVELFPMEKLN